MKILSKLKAQIIYLPVSFLKKDLTNFMDAEEVCLKKV